MYNYDAGKGGAWCTLCAPPPPPQWNSLKGSPIAEVEFTVESNCVKELSLPLKQILKDIAHTVLQMARYTFSVTNRGCGKYTRAEVHRISYRK